jgi:2-dehydropantoate 2-reductase
MRVVIAGAGALGSLLGGYFAEAGAEVTLLARPAHAEAIERQGLRIEGVRGERVVRNLRAVSDPGAIEGADLLIQAVKSYDAAAMLASLGHLRGRVGLAVSVQNGGGKDEELAAAFGAEVVAGAATMVGGAMPEPGRALHTGEGATWIGELDGRPSERLEAVAALYREAGLRIEVRPDIRAVIWCKLHQFVPAAALACLTRLRLHEIYLDPELARLFVEMSREVARIAAHRAIALVDLPGFAVQSVCRLPFAEAVESVHERGRVMRAKGMTGVRISTLQDLERGRRTELEETIGYVVRLAEGCGVSMPKLDVCYRILRGLATSRES